MVWKSAITWPRGAANNFKEALTLSISMPWYVYIIECKDGTLYTGVTNNIERRLKAHNSGKGCRYTRSRRPVKIVYSEAYPGKSESQKREAYIKSLGREQKLQLCGKSRGDFTVLQLS